MKTYRTTKVYIDKNHALFSWCDQVTSLANNLANACRFRQRQLFTSSKKEDSELTSNEKEVIKEFQSTLNCTREELPRSPGWKTIDKVMKHCSNPDYYAKGLPRQSAQQVLKRCCQDMTSYFGLLSAWREKGCPADEKPNLPGYRRKGGYTSVPITNQDCTIRADKSGNKFAGLPFAKEMPLPIGKPEGRLKQADICPDNGKYVIIFTFEVEIPDVVSKERPERIAAIDFGVDNLMAVSNNCGLPHLLYKGGIIKSVNQKYNKTIAAIMKEEMAKPDCPKNKKGEPKFVPTDESKQVTLNRNNFVRDYMHKTAKRFVSWCVENRIDTIVAGVNIGAKQRVNIKNVNNQNFVQIPFAYLRHCIQYLCEAYGIRYVEREESYTSLASCPDGDYIPTYGVDDEKASFSGRRKPRRYKGMHKSDGFRGLYKTADESIINSDLNAAANILRKEYPDAFDWDTQPDFTKVLIIRHPDEDRIAANRAKQLNNSSDISKSKAKRDRRKAV